ncbi:MAG: hypothetical protein INQ03_06790 [Candidatus Heimdallarchaeota archaeon]|nr:hypothetical protein [Candidatus Heimdallarchaeota archaeon]
MINSSDSLPELGEYVFSYHREHQRIHIVPSFHDDVSFSNLSRSLLDTIKPDCVALELPVELEDLIMRAMDRLPSFTVIHVQEQQEFHYHSPAYIVHPGEILYWMGYLARERGIPLSLLDTLVKAPPSISQPLSYYELASIGWRRYYDLLDIQAHYSHAVHRTRTVLMADKILQCADQNILVIIGAAHWPGIHLKLLASNVKPDFDSINFDVPLDPVSLQPLHAEWMLSRIHPHTIHLASRSLPAIISSMVSHELEGKQLDVLDAYRQIFFDAEKVYTQKFDDTIGLGSYIRLFQYLRNLCRINGKLLPDLYDLILAAKGMADDDFAYEVFRIAVHYPYHDESIDSEIKFTPDSTQGEVIQFAFKRRYKRPVLKEVDNLDDFDPIPEEEYPGHWKEVWDEQSPFGYVSYPPEDEFLERYLRFLEKKLEDVLREERASSMEFEASLEDGIDWRETISHYHEKKIYVKKYPRDIPKIGCIIVQFLEEPIDQAYRHYTTMYAEHDQESHISILTTEVGKEFVGPGISRVKYAALISQFPPIGYPVRIPIGGDDLKIRLLYAAMNMSLSNIIGFVSPRPPTPAQRFFASHYGFRIVYIPMVQLSKSSMNRLRTMHLLANRSLRDDASEYIGF